MELSYFKTMFRLTKAERIPAGIASVLAVLVLLVWISRGSNDVVVKDREWHFYTPSDPIVVSDGSEVVGVPIMSRWNGSTWEYRKMSRSEKEHLHNLIGLPPLDRSSQP